MVTLKENRAKACEVTLRELSYVVLLKLTK